MAKAWKDVIASPQYQALAPEQKAQAQEQYFNEVVAPKAGESVEQAKQAFYAAYPLPSTNAIDRSQSATQNIQHTSSDNSLASGYAKLATQQREGLERS
ncbi:injection protein, partial [Escherichia coli]